MITSPRPWPPSVHFNLITKELLTPIQLSFSQLLSYLRAATQPLGTELRTHTLCRSPVPLASCLESLLRPHHRLCGESFPCEAIIFPTGSQGVKSHRERRGSHHHPFTAPRAPHANEARALPAAQSPRGDMPGQLRRRQGPTPGPSPFPATRPLPRNTPHTGKAPPQNAGVAAVWGGCFPVSRENKTVTCLQRPGLPHAHA